MLEACLNGEELCRWTCLPDVGIDVRRVSYVALTLPPAGPLNVNSGSLCTNTNILQPPRYPLGFFSPTLASWLDCVKAVPSRPHSQNGKALSCFFCSWGTCCMYMIRQLGGWSLVETTPKDSTNMYHLSHGYLEPATLGCTLDHLDGMVAWCWYLLSLLFG